MASPIVAADPNTGFCSAGKPLVPGAFPAEPIRARTVRSGIPKSAPSASGRYILGRNIRQVCETWVLTVYLVGIYLLGTYKDTHAYGS
jgi:hypothetical protein